MTSEEAIKTEKAMAQSLKQSKEVKTPTQTVQMVKDSKLPPRDLQQSVLLEKFSKE